MRVLPSLVFTPFCVSLTPPSTLNPHPPPSPSRDTPTMAEGFHEVKYEDGDHYKGARRQRLLVVFFRLVCRAFFHTAPLRVTVGQWNADGKRHGLGVVRRAAGLATCAMPQALPSPARRSTPTPTPPPAELCRRLVLQGTVFAGHEQRQRRARVPGPRASRLGGGGQRGTVHRVRRRVT